MKLNSYTPLLFILLIGLCTPCMSQDQLRSKADHAFRHQDYVKALEYLEDYPSILKDKDAVEKRALCYLNTNQLAKAFNDLKLSRHLGNKNPDLYWFMAQCQHHQENYDEAIRYYKEYIAKSGSKSKYYIRAQKEIKNCLYSSSDKRKLEDGKALVQRFDDNINSSFDEITPVQSPSFGNIFYLSTNNNKKSFLIKTSSIDSTGAWSINSSTQQLYEEYSDATIQDISSNGKALLFSVKSSDAKYPDYYFTFMDSLSNEYLIPLEEAVFDFATDIQIVNNNTLAFASQEFNALGGYDIFTIQYLDGQWTSPVNAGPSVNSSSNERSPCFSENLNSLYFSSDRAYSYGGYDLYAHKKGGATYNLGASVNSPGNELQLKLDKDGHMGVFSSNRKSGKGGYDIYFLYLQNPDPIRSETEEDFHFIADKMSSYEPVRKNNTAVIQIEDPKPVTEIKTDSIVLVEKVDYPYPYTIFYEDSHDLGSATATNKLRQMQDFLLNENMHILIQAHTDQNEPGLPEYVQYSCLKRAVKIGESLVDLGFPPGAIHIESLANNYPLIRSEIAGEPLDSLSYMNKRIEIIFYKNDSLLSEIKQYPKNKISPLFLERNFQLLETIQEDLYYSVQIASTDRMFKNANLRLYNDVFIRKEGLESTNDYYIGFYTNLDDAKAAQSDLLNSKISDAEIVVFFNRNKLNPEQIRVYSTEYPELLKLLD